MTSPTNAIALYKQPVCIISQMSFCDQGVLLLLSSSDGPRQATNVSEYLFFVCWRHSSIISKSCKNYQRVLY